MFEEEKALILGAIGHAIIAIEHVGSTAVSGLGAKPVIDITAGIRSLDDAPACVKSLQSLGYTYVPEFEAAIPERRYFHKGPEQARTHHLHMVELTSEFWERHLLFRDFLRAHPDVAQEYEALKRQLANQFGTDRVGYTEAKTSFIRAIEERARAAKATSA
jgi:GrpB-like predicted nucleotidyltransferase (UPF0157 family)